MKTKAKMEKEHSLGSRGRSKTTTGGNVRPRASSDRESASAPAPGTMDDGRPGVITIRVREGSSDNNARVMGHRITASCTMGPKFAADRAAAKYFCGRVFELRKVKEGSVSRGEPSEFEAEYVAPGKEVRG
jgi:hypothetical protein